MLPTVCILDGSVGRTGALTAAESEAALLKDHARVVLILPKHAKLSDADTALFAAIERIDVAMLRKSLSSVILYLPRLFVGAWQLTKLLRKHDCQRLQVNDFYFAQGHLTRVFGFRWTIATWLRINPAAFSLAGKLWLWLAKP
jgi:hypothetical protein